MGFRRSRKVPFVNSFLLAGRFHNIFSIRFDLERKLRRDKKLVRIRDQYTSKDQVKLVLVGNKSDLERKVKNEEGKKLAAKEGMLFFETSAKTADGIVDMFYTSFSMIDFFDSIRKGNIDDNWKNNILFKVNNIIEYFFRIICIL